MYDDEIETEDGRNDGPLNWADIAWCLFTVPYFTAKGFMVAFENIQLGLVNSSRAIDERQKFARTAGASIESISRGDT